LITVGSDKLFRLVDISQRELDGDVTVSREEKVSTSPVSTIMVQLFMAAV
jgi:hypothetical protein